MFRSRRSLGLMFVGLMLPLITACSAANPSVTPPAAPAAGEPKISQEPITLSPSVNAQITKIQFFEGERSKRAFIAERKYESRFAATMARTIYTEINLGYPQPEATLYFPITLHFRRNGRTVRIEEVENRIGPDWSLSSHIIGAGHFDAGKWPVGRYEVDVYVNLKKAATAYFEVY